MSRQDYIALADALNRTEASPQTVEAVADVMQDDNPRFQRSRFYAAASAVDIGDDLAAIVQIQRQRIDYLASVLIDLGFELGELLEP